MRMEGFFLEFLRFCDARPIICLLLDLVLPVYTSFVKIHSIELLLLFVGMASISGVVMMADWIWSPRNYLMLGGSTLSCWLVLNDKYTLERTSIIVDLRLKSALSVNVLVNFFLSRLNFIARFRLPLKESFLNFIFWQLLLIRTPYPAFASYLRFKRTRILHLLFILYHHLLLFVNHFLLLLLQPFLASLIKIVILYDLL